MGFALDKVRKIPAPMRKNVGTPPPPNKQKTPPKMRNFMGMEVSSCRKNQKSQVPIKLAQPFPVLELQANVFFADVRRFLARGPLPWKTPVSFSLAAAQWTPCFKFSETPLQTSKAHSLPGPCVASHWGLKKGSSSENECRHIGYLCVNSSSQRQDNTPIVRQNSTTGSWKVLWGSAIQL